jgi:hypothetical protein
MAPNLSRILIWVIVGIYIFWRLYVRLQRMIGRQQFRKGRLVFLIVLYGLGSVGLAVFTMGRLHLVAGWLGGLVPGVLLGLWALQLTQYETVEGEECYTPNARIGVALFLLFLGRIVYRAVAIYTHFSLPGHPTPPLGQSALTDLTFELLAGYYIAYSVGILRHYGRAASPLAPLA